MDANKKKRSVSIIVPVYNAEMYLEEMIDSILNQRYSDWELLLVDNFSKDKSLDVCRRYAEKDSRIRVMQEKKKGVSAVRNCGLQSASGRYIMFVDADDFLPDNDTLERFVIALQDGKHDIAVANYERLWNRKRLKAASHTAFSGEDPESEDFRFQGFFSVGTLSYVWGKLYRRRFLEENGIKFENVSYAEDKLFNMECYLCKARYAFVSESGYVYRKNDQSVSFRYRPDSKECWLRIAYKLRSFLAQKKKEEEQCVYQSFIYYLLFFAVFFDAKMEYMKHGHSIYSVVKLMRRYHSEQLVKKTFHQLRRKTYTGKLSQKLWKGVIYGFSSAMCLHLYHGLALGIKLLIDCRIDERLSDTGLRE